MRTKTCVQVDSSLLTNVLLLDWNRGGTALSFCIVSLRFVSSIEVASVVVEVSEWKTRPVPEVFCRKPALQHCTAGLF